MKKVCIIVFIALITLLTKDVIITFTDIIIFIILFVFSFNLSLYIGKYLKIRKERQHIDLLIKKLEKCINQ